MQTVNMNMYDGPRQGQRAKDEWFLHGWRTRSFAWLIAAALGPSAYGNVQWFFGTFIGRVVLLGYTWALIHHTLGGIRHLFWDTGHGLGDREIDWLARATIGGSIVLTLVVWIIGYLVMR